MAGVFIAPVVTAESRFEKLDKIVLKF